MESQQGSNWFGDSGDLENLAFSDVGSFASDDADGLGGSYGAVDSEGEGWDAAMLDEMDEEGGDEGTVDDDDNGKP